MKEPFSAAIGCKITRGEEGLLRGVNVRVDSLMVFTDRSCCLVGVTGSFISEGNRLLPREGGLGRRFSELSIGRDVKAQLFSPSSRYVGSPLPGDNTCDM